ncbi:DUF6452 family protein [Flavobacteriaceae bacterium]|nr:DUF6452 family protein [Flavobacteriaceae bacterium]MDB9889681.1 DUF6452 family protein [Flavobacteriaceae bacterium]MDC1394446.1 DUF6452 family protein [Flavobacteriaceae bacterium]
MKRSILFLVIALGCFWSCEKDDICIAGDTPMMRITFVNFIDETLEKAPERLLIVGKDKTTPITTISPGSSSITEALIPLVPNTNQTEYYLVTNASIDSEGNVSGNIDALILSYTPNPKYISKACGYIVSYDNLIPILTPDTDNWIKKITILSPSITNENEVHLKIYH